MATLLAGCTDTTVTAPVDLAPHAPELSECAACGMVVREQPAPRGQVVYRGGEHRFTCSLGDLRATLQNPDPLGRPERVYVEVLPEGFDAASADPAPHPWMPAEDAWYVFGAKRPHVMGIPVLSFADREAAEVAATSYSTAPVPWEAVLRTPFNETPPSEVP
ncbi:MAG: nitrous oxide reductase accessory protein NosL [Deltaproteobacteria bacterium]|nr:nitrous oxide reductase accessory protein NosL [Deltaproteobacteria bacterium]